MYLKGGYSLYIVNEKKNLKRFYIFICLSIETNKQNDWNEKKNPLTATLRFSFFLDVYKKNQGKNCKRKKKKENNENVIWEGK